MKRVFVATIIGLFFVLVVACSNQSSESKVPENIRKDLWYDSVRVIEYINPCIEGLFECESAINNSIARLRTLPVYMEKGEHSKEEEKIIYSLIELVDIAVEYELEEDATEKAKRREVMIKRYNEIKNTLNLK